MKTRELLKILDQMVQKVKAPPGLHERIMRAAQAVDPLAPGAMTEAVQWDRALPQAAAAEFQGTMRIPSQRGKYTIILRRSRANPQQGVITVEVTKPYRAQLEGHCIILRDGRGHPLVDGRIVDGEVSQVVENLADLSLGFDVEPA